MPPQRGGSPLPSGAARPALACAVSIPVHWVAAALAAACLLPFLPATAEEHAGAPASNARGEFPHVDEGDAAFTAEQVRAAVSDYIGAKLREGGGVFRLTDDATGERLELEFIDVAIVGVAALWRIHNPAREVENRGYFACTDFHAAGAPKEKRYDVDVWVSPRSG